MALKYVPKGYQAVTPYIVVTDAAKMIDFLAETFLAKEVFRQETARGVHIELLVGDTKIMVGAGADDHGLKAMFLVYVPDVDAAYARALQCGGQSITPPADQEHGDRRAGVSDMFGNLWYMATSLKKRKPRRRKTSMRSVRNSKKNSKR